MKNPSPRNAEQLLAASEVRYRRLFESAKDGILILDADSGVIIDANPFITELLGYSLAECLGKHIWDLRSLKNVAASKEKFLELQRQGYVRYEDIPLETAQGEIKPVEFVSNIYQMGNVRVIQCNIRDISQRKRAEETLRESMVFQNSLLNAIPIPVFYKDRDGRYLGFNNAYETYFGTTRDQLIGKSVYDINPRELAEIYQAKDAELIESGGVQQYEFQVKNTHGELRDVIFNKALFADSRGNISGLIGAILDITGRKRDEEAVERLNRELRAISFCNQALIRAKDEQALLNDICHIVCDEAGYRMAWVGYAEHDAAKTIRPVAWAGAEDGYLSQTQPTWADTELGLGPCGTAICSGESTRIRDFTSEPQSAPWSDNALQRGYRSSIALPLKDESGNAFGVINIYSTEPDAFTSGEIRLLNELAGDLAFGIMALRAGIERKRTEQERLVRLRFVENMDLINRAMQRAEDLEKMLRDVLKSVLTIFDCDRVWLFYPCDPDAASFRVPMEIAKPEYSGAEILNVDIPMPPDMAGNLREALESADPVTYVVGTERPINKVSAEQFGVKSMMMVALYPKSGRPWAFGMHQCAYARVWTQEEQSLFLEISRRLADGLTGLLSHRDLRESETKYRRIVDTAIEGIWEFGPDTLTTFVNARMAEILGYANAEMIGRPMSDFMFAEDVSDHLIKMENRRQGLAERYERRFRCKNGETLWTHISATPILDVDHRYSGSFGMITDITEIKQAESEIHRLAYYDLLTKLPNRRLLQNRLGQAIAATARSGLYGALFFIDIDRFKALNDSRGHDVGDLLLIDVAQRLREKVREKDTVARQGGDEFVVLMEELGKSDNDAAVLAGQYGDKLREALAAPFNLNGYEYHCETSIGVGLFHGQNTVEDLFKHADLALYQAKNSGRNMLRFFNPAMQDAMEQRNILEAALHKVVTLKQLRLYYQPQLDVGHRVIGVEALVRWQHPQRGLVPPDDFIPLAEDTGLILPIGRWVMETACAQIKTWENDALASTLQIAVNVSARQFRQPDFVTQVQSALATSGANPARLKLELTESMLLDDIKDTIAKMQEIKKLGVLFSMDDFGTGYSSLSYLAQLPLDQIKIDKSFVRNLPGVKNDETIARSIITMGLGLDLNVIAEGVETENQREFLEALGCLEYQGYLFSRPLPLSELEAYLKLA